MPNSNDTADYSQPTTALLLPAFTVVENLHPSNTAQLITAIVNRAPTNDSSLAPFSLPATVPSPSSSVPALATRPCPHSAVILMCSQRTRDARCGQSAPLLRKELERHLRPLGLYRDVHDSRPGGVGIYFISHVGGHKYSANVMIYRRPNAFGLDEVQQQQNETTGKDREVEGKTSLGYGKQADEQEEKGEGGGSGEGNGESEDVGAAQCIWLARVRPEDCENLVRYTVLRGKVVKPESQLRGGFDRSKGLLSW